MGAFGMPPFIAMKNAKVAAELKTPSVESAPHTYLLIISLKFFLLLNSPTFSVIVRYYMVLQLLLYMRVVDQQYDSTVTNIYHFISFYVWCNSTR